MLRLPALLLLTVAFTAGCESYATPGAPADLATFGGGHGAEAGRRVLTDYSVQTAMDKKPLAKFPTAIALVRVQGSGYHSETCQSFGTGRYSVITTRDVETPEQVAHLRKLPLVIDVAPVNRLLLPESLQTDLELRNAAAAIHADMVLIYTFDTQFKSEDAAPPVMVVSLGLFPTKVSKIISTASAVLIDTRNGYVYALAEATVQKDAFSNAWLNKLSVDSSRREAEGEALEKMIGDFDRAWGEVVNRYALVK